MADAVATAGTPEERSKLTPMQMEAGTAAAPGKRDPCARVTGYMRFEDYDPSMLTTAPCGSCCCTAKTMFWAIRALCGVYTLWHTFDVWGYDDLRDWSHSFMYLTCWGAALTTAYFVLAVLMLHKSGDAEFQTGHAAPSQGVSRVNTDCFGPAWSVMRRLQWVLFQLVFVMQFVIVGMYWFAIYDWDKEETYDLDFLNNISVHGLFFGLLIIELFASRAVFVARHQVWVALTSLIYLIVNMISTKDYEPVYSVLTWDDMDTVIIVIEAYVLMFLGFLLGLGLTKLRDRCCCGGGATAPAKAQLDG